jgi:hypothetical protein
MRSSSDCTANPDDEVVDAGAFETIQDFSNLSFEILGIYIERLLTFFAHVYPKVERHHQRKGEMSSFLRLAPGKSLCIACAGRRHRREHFEY